MKKPILPTLSEVLSLGESTLNDCLSLNSEWTAAENRHRLKAEREWWAATAALEKLLLQTVSMNSNTSANTADDYLLPAEGLVLAGPMAVLSHKTLLSMPTWIFKAELSRVGTLFQLPPATEMPAKLAANAGSVVPLLSTDPLANEQFCLVLTTDFSLVMVLGQDLKGIPEFKFSFEPEVVEQAWQALRSRIEQSSPHFPLAHLDALVKQYYPIEPDYRTVTHFSRLLLKYLPEVEVANSQEQARVESSLVRVETPVYSHSQISRPDVELLQAFAHEVRTPLTTIRTLTRLLLKRRDLATDAIKRLKIIDHECTEQIDRMELLFQAAELEASKVKHCSTQLTAMSLSQVLQQSIPRWHSSANRRNLTLDVALPQHLPTVVSDPIMLDRVLTGLIENFTRSLPAGSHIQVQVIPAGDQLKLQLLAQSQPGESGTAEQFLVPPARKSLGQLLTFQPETGNISLNLTATKHLFQAIGGKLIVRQHPHQGEVLTIFLPLEVSC